nr:ribonuclease H-like domain, reverse transcriptase, RNA-dependent DNA polymerase [Tanacetum cinerariifolium]
MEEYVILHTQERLKAMKGTKIGIKAIRLFLAYASFMGFMVYQMDVKSAFLYERIKEEVYVYQPLGFEDPDHPNKVYKVVKALYGLHQAPRACHEKYVAELLRKFNFSDEKFSSTPVDMEKTLVKDVDGDDVDVHLYRSMIGSLMYLSASRLDIIDSLFELVAYTDSDYAGASLDMRSTTGGFAMNMYSGFRIQCWIIVLNTLRTERNQKQTERRFWQTATASTLDNGEMEITATIYGKVKVVTEESVRRHLKLKDSDGAPSTSRTHLLLTPKSSFRQETKVPQSSSPPHTNVANEAASTGVDVRHGRAATTVTSLDVGPRSDNINKTPSIPHHSPLLRVYTLGSDKGRMQHNELMDLVTQLSNKVVALKTDLKQTKKVYGAAYTKLIMKYSKPVSTASVAVTTASVSFSPASPARRVSNDDDITTAETLVYIRRSAAKDKGKGIMTAFEPVQNKTKLQQEQERLGYKAAVRLQEELDEEERQRMAKFHEATQSFTKGRMGKH